MKTRLDGSVQSSNVPTINNTRNAQNYDNKIYRALVVNVIFSDDVSNISKNSRSPEIFYDVILLGGPRTGTLLSNCKVMNPMGGSIDFYHRVLKPSSLSISGTRLEDQDGDIVYVAFIQGNTSYPVIIGVETQSNLLDEDSKAPTTEEGFIFKNQYNGVTEIINKFGDYFLTVKGDKSFNEETGKLEVNTEQSTYFGSLSISKEGMILGDQVFTISSFQNVFNRVVGINNDGIFKFQETISVQDERLVREFESGLTITEDGKNDVVTIETEGGALIVINGQSGFINLKVNTTEVIISTLSGKITLNSDLVDLGNSVADLVVKYTELKAQFDAHFHLVPQSITGVLPSQPPAVGLLPTAGSIKVAVS